MQIRITSQLTKSQQQRLRRGNSDVDAYVHRGPNLYEPITDDPYELHQVARHMMVRAGTTFEYEVVNA